MVESKQLGRKTGQGFYTWKDGKAIKPKIPSDFRITDELIDRLMLPLINEAAACLREGIVEDSDLLDAGVIFGCGFAPFTGGPINYAKDRGIDSVVARMNELEKKFGSRFAADDYWAELNMAHKSTHDTADKTADSAA